MDSLVVIIYLAAMVGFGIWGRYKAKNQDDFLVAGRRLGGWLYTGTMSAVVLGGASTIGGVGLGYTSGLSGMWLVFSIGLGIILLSLFWKKLTNMGALSGMIVGAVTVVVWGTMLSGGIFDLYEILPGFVFALVVAVLVSNATYTYDPEVEAEFDEAVRLSKIGKEGDTTKVAAN